MLPPLKEVSHDEGKAPSSKRKTNNSNSLSHFAAPKDTILAEYERLDYLPPLTPQPTLAAETIDIDPEPADEPPAKEEQHDSFLSVDTSQRMEEPTDSPQVHRFSSLDMPASPVEANNDDFAYGSSIPVIENNHVTKNESTHYLSTSDPVAPSHPEPDAQLDFDFEFDSTPVVHDEVVKEEKTEAVDTISEVANTLESLPQASPSASEAPVDDFDFPVQHSLEDLDTTQNPPVQKSASRVSFKEPEPKEEEYQDDFFELEEEEQEKDKRDQVPSLATDSSATPTISQPSLHFETPRSEMARVLQTILHTDDESAPF